MNGKQLQYIYCWASLCVDEYIRIVADFTVKSKRILRFSYWNTFVLHFGTYTSTHKKIGWQYDRDPVLWFRTVKHSFIISTLLHPVDYNTLLAALKKCQFMDTLLEFQPRSLYGVIQWTSIFHCSKIGSLRVVIYRVVCHSV